VRLLFAEGVFHFRWKEAQAIMAVVGFGFGGSQ
jgi:hypothetical protein